MSLEELIIFVLIGSEANQSLDRGYLLNGKGGNIKVLFFTFLFLENHNKGDNYYGPYYFYEDFSTMNLCLPFKPDLVESRVVVIPSVTSRTGDRV